MTKKYFEGYAPEVPKKNIGFIAPVRVDGNLVFQSIKSKKDVSQFVLVYTGVDLTSEIVFQKMVDGGFVFESVKKTLDDIDTLLKIAKASKIGHVYKQNSHTEFDFECLGRLRRT
ncbi:MAG TPA: hypothetical protein ACFCUC_17740 [Desulfobacterales bacterium]